MDADGDYLIDQSDLQEALSSEEEWLSNLKILDE